MRWHTKRQHLEPSNETSLRRYTNKYDRGNQSMQIAVTSQLRLLARIHSKFFVNTTSQLRQLDKIHSKFLVNATLRRNHADQLIPVVFISRIR